MRLLSPAKLNLSLRVRGKRSDGYHEVVYLTHAIGLCDYLDIHPSSHDHFTANMAVTDDNLVLRALRLFKSKTGLSDSFTITLDKRIPIEAGLGGGSSNAATTLWALNYLTGSGILESQLALWGAELGVDVPFFFSRGAALCAGRGDSLTEQVPHTGEVWVAKPPFGLSTPAVYARISHTHGKDHPHPSDHLSDIAHHQYLVDIGSSQYQKSDQTGCGSLSHGYEKCGLARSVANPSQLTLYENDLEQAARTIYPELSTLKQALYALGFSTVCMTGSGSAFFCLGSVLCPELPGVTFYKTTFIHRQQNSWYVQ